MESYSICLFEMSPAYNNLLKGHPCYVAYVKMSFLFKAGYYSIGCIHHTLFIHSSVHGYLGCFWLLRMIAMNMGAQIVVQVPAFFFGYTPRSGIAGSYSNSALLCWLSVRIHLPRQKTQIQSLSWENPLENEMATYSIILAWAIPWPEEPSRLQSTVSQRSWTWLSN